MSNLPGASMYLLTAAVALAVAGVHSAPSSSEAKQLCQDRTGLKAADIADFHKRNEGCSVDCTTRQGTIMSYYVQKGAKCGAQETHSCSFGKCLAKSDQASLELGDLYSVQIKILSAQVPDLDTLPMGGPSDAFVVVEADKNGDPSYDDGEIMCHTYIVQDNEHPKWDFQCRPLPLRLSSRIKFDLFDSDKPSENHDHIGFALRSVEELLNKGPQRLALRHNDRDDQYYVEVELTGQEYDSSA